MAQLELDPSIELLFKGPFNVVVISRIQLNNPTDEILLFNVKTTAPRHYCVRPNKGVLYPHSQQDVCVMLQPFDPNITETVAHKFMVQYMVSPPDFSPEQLDKIWSTTASSQVMRSRKLHCTFIEEASEDQVTMPTLQLELGEGSKELDNNSIASSRQRLERARVKWVEQMQARVKKSE